MTDDSRMTVDSSSQSKQCAITPKELRHIAQGCRASRLPWVTEIHGSPTPTGLRHPILANDATLSG